MASQFCYHAELSEYLILDVPGLNTDVCFLHGKLSECADKIKAKIELWLGMDILSAADDISLCSNTNAYLHSVNSFPDGPLALFSPLLRRLAACGPSENLGPLLCRSLEGADQVVTWWEHFKDLRKISRKGHFLIGRCVVSMIETEGREAVALHNLRHEVRAFYDAVSAHQTVPEQRYVLACINDFSSTIPSESPLEDISAFKESFDNFTLALNAMVEFSNARDRFDWIEKYRRNPHQSWQNLEVQADFWTDNVSTLRNIRGILLQLLGYYEFLRIHEISV